MQHFFKNQAISGGKVLLLLLMALLSLPVLAQDEDAAKKDTRPSRIRVGVIGFVDQSREFPNIGNVSDAATTSISHNNHFNLIDHGALPDILKELKLDSSGYIDESTKKDLGKIKGIDYIIYGAVNEANTKEVRNTYKNQTTVSYKAHIRVTYHVTNIQTGETRSESFSKDVTDSSESDTLIGRALDQASQAMTHWLLNIETVAAKVTKVDAEEKSITINLGSEQGVSKEQVFKIYIPAGAGLQSAKDDEEDDICVGYARPVVVHKNSSEMEMIGWGKLPPLSIKKGWRAIGGNDLKAFFDREQLEKYNKGRRKRERRHLLAVDQLVISVDSGEPKE